MENFTSKELNFIKTLILNDQNVNETNLERTWDFTPRHKQILDKIENKLMRIHL